MATVTCHTGGCAKENEAVPDVGISYVDQETGETVRVDSVVCGACGNEITDIQE